MATLTEKVYQYAMIPLIAYIGGDLTNSQEERLYYKKPSGVTGYWNAVIYDAIGGKITYETGESDFDETGTWILQGWETDEFGHVNFGQSYSLKINRIPTWVDESPSI